MSLNSPQMRRDGGLPGSTSTSFFNQASQVQNTGTMNIRVENNSNVHSSQTSGKNPKELLLSHCALDALVDSNERFDPPKCAPHTRDAIQTDIVDWANILILSGLVMWLTGSAGSGKSAIAQTIAERFIREGIPCAGFFFSRISGSSTRVDGDRLLPTIIYQLTLLIPEYKAAVMKKLNKDPAMFQRSRGSQMSALFTKPLQQFSLRRIFRELRGGRPTPLVIIIDGLDECRNPQVQCDLLRVIADAATSIRRRPVRFLIASRPEAHLTRTFDQHRNFREGGLRRINLDDDQDAAVAILTFLRQEICKIHEEHPLRNHLDPSWPSQEILDFIVSKSSPQFILASTIMSYVASPKHRPTERLSAIVEILNQPTASVTDKPLQRMDMLYTFIFDGIEEEHRELVEAILGILHLASLEEYQLPLITSEFLEKTLCLEPGEVYLRLEPLASVIQLPESPITPIKSLHASLFDFLLSSARSKDLALDLNHAHAGLLGRKLLQDPEETLQESIVIPPSPIIRMALEGLVNKISSNRSNISCGY
ncbi:hypothetical protein CPB83DRAFT_158098 [Crepidotus variabilis]|uniref:Nephrocystin 3-like N-terminal domain-containing protein n=1 Tax=Crepidotus variabilis TaxID=179855 RepID=A0A9P6EKK0_9AGAR|nr:hypothetical protein CPB83DRAFT_158098 [Crepidotus variabilis]